MLDGIESITTAALGLALDAASQRQQVIAANIANANTVGYVPQRLSFEDQLDDVRRGLQSGKKLDAYALAAMQPHLTPVVDGSGQAEKVQLDQEVAALSQNSVQYQALIKGLNRHMSILNIAVTDGKR
jgi:flagellar basal-body rod protein FlgB